MHLKLLFIKHTCGRHELALGIIKEWPNSRGLLFIIRRWSAKCGPRSGHNSSNTCECINRFSSSMQAAFWFRNLSKMMYTASCANLSCSLGIYQSTVPPFYQAGKINKTSGRATEWKKSTALLPDQNSSMVKVTRVNCNLKYACIVG